MKKEDGRFVAMATRDLQALGFEFDQVMFNSLFFTWERNFDLTFLKRVEKHPFFKGLK